MRKRLQPGEGKTFNVLCSTFKVRTGEIKEQGARSGIRGKRGEEVKIGKTVTRLL